MFSVKLVTALSYDDTYSGYALKCLSKQLQDYFGNSLTRITKATLQMSESDPSDQLEVFVTKNGRETRVFQHLGVPGSLSMKLLDPRLFFQICHLVLPQVQSSWHPELTERRVVDLLSKAIKFYADPFAHMMGDVCAAISCTTSELRCLPICAEAYAGGEIDRLIWAYYLLMPTGDNHTLLIGPAEERPILCRLFAHFCANPPTMRTSEFLEFVRCPLFEILAPGQLLSQRENILRSNGASLFKDDHGLSVDEFAHLVFERASLDPYQITRVMELDEKVLGPVGFSKADQGLLSLVHFSHDSLLFIEYIFQQLDVNNDGHVDPKDLDSIRQFIEDHLRSKELVGVDNAKDSLFGMDVNDDGFVSLNEWLSFFGRITNGDPTKLPSLLVNDLNLLDVVFEIAEEKSGERLSDRKARVVKAMTDLARTVADVDENGVFSSEISFLDYNHHLFGRLPSQEAAKKAATDKDTVEAQLFSLCEDDQDVEDTIVMIQSILDVPVATVEQVQQSRQAQLKANLPPAAKLAAEKARQIMYSLISDSKHSRRGDFHPVIQDAEMLIKSTYRSNVDEKDAAAILKEANNLRTKFAALRDAHAETCRLVAMLQCLGKVGKTEAPHANRTAHALGRTFDAEGGLQALERYNNSLRKEVPAVDGAVLKTVGVPRLDTFAQLETKVNAAIAAYEEDKNNTLPTFIVQVASETYHITESKACLEKLARGHEEQIRFMWALSQFPSADFPDTFGRMSSDIWHVEYNPTLGDVALSLTTSFDEKLMALNEDDVFDAPWGPNEKFRFKRLGTGKTVDVAGLCSRRMWVTQDQMLEWIRQHDTQQKRVRRTSSIGNIGSMGRGRLGTSFCPSPRTSSGAMPPLINRLTRSRSRTSRESPKSRRQAARRRGRSRNRLRVMSISN